MNKPSFEAAIKKNVEKPIQENKAANTTQEAGSQTPPPLPPRTSSLPPKGNVVSEQTSAEPASAIKIIGKKMNGMTALHSPRLDILRLEKKKQLLRRPCK
ncbi:hypothetical protein [Wolbachia endosymbiont of Cimex lectularius]|uniref:hypothetical protein n=1 Tax=Wolbachia endosymbiont of Cimex lectularius TaxID=246273 RepID=UPI000694AA3A|nr:hypothetical protein [Wolbachia endosymbiont of Cimex lectularius]